MVTDESERRKKRMRMRLGEWQRYFISCGNRESYRLIKTLFLFLFLFQNFIFIYIFCIDITLFSLNFSRHNIYKLKILLLIKNIKKIIEDPNKNLRYFIYYKLAKI